MNYYSKTRGLFIQGPYSIENTKLNVEQSTVDSGGGKSERLAE